MKGSQLEVMLEGCRGAPSLAEEKFAGWMQKVWSRLGPESSRGHLLNAAGCSACPWATV